MEILKKIFPLSFKYIGSAANLVIGILLYLVLGLLGGVVIGVAVNIPVVNLLCGIAGGLLDLYVVAGIVIEILAHCKVLK